MNLLESMTGASPETKLILLTWLTRLGPGFHSRTMTDFESTLGVPKRYLGRALNYLTTEGYLNKIKYPLVPSKEKIPRVRFSYALSNECLYMWEQCLAAYFWQRELIGVLNGASLAGESSAKRPKVITINTRLVWAAFLMRSNSARYVFGSDESFCQLMGMKGVTFRKAIKALADIGVITIAANGVNRSKLHCSLSPIYKIPYLYSNTKHIKLGLGNAISGTLSLRCVSDLVNSYRSKCRQSNGPSPNQNLYLTDLQYFQLSEFFSCNKLVSWINHFYLSTIFCLLPTFSTLSLGHGLDSRTEELRKQFYNSLSYGLFNYQIIPFLPNVAISDQDTDHIEVFRRYLLDTLVEELLNKIFELNDSWRLLVECMGREGLIVDYQIGETMISKSKPLIKGDELESDSKMNFYTRYVLTLLVPNSDQYCDCMILGKQLLTSNSSLKHEKVEHVELSVK